MFYENVTAKQKHMLQIKELKLITKVKNTQKIKSLVKMKNSKTTKIKTNLKQITKPAKQITKFKKVKMIKQKT